MSALRSGGPARSAVGGAARDGRHRGSVPPLDLGPLSRFRPVAAPLSARVPGSPRSALDVVKPGAFVSPGRRTDDGTEQRCESSARARYQNSARETRLQRARGGSDTLQTSAKCRRNHGCVGPTFVPPATARVSSHRVGLPVVTRESEPRENGGVNRAAQVGRRLDRIAEQLQTLDRALQLTRPRAGLTLDVETRRARVEALERCLRLRRQYDVLCDIEYLARYGRPKRAERPGRLYR